MSHIVRYHDIPKTIISDRGSILVARFWEQNQKRQRVTESYMDSLNNQRIGKGLEVGLLYIVIEDASMLQC
jgi:hypothetical protein